MRGAEVTEKQSGMHGCSSGLKLAAYLATNQQHNATHNSLPLSKEQPHRDLHANSHEEESHEETLIWSNVTLHLQGKLCLCHKQASLQCDNINADGRGSNMQLS